MTESAGDEKRIIRKLTVKFTAKSALFLLLSGKGWKYRGITYLLNTNHNISFVL